MTVKDVVSLEAGFCSLIIVDMIAGILPWPDFDSALGNCCAILPPNLMFK
jgi:hypothetical protein